MEQERQATKLRQRQWMYLGPIAATPIAHICVTLYRDARTPRQKQLLLGVGILGATAATIGMRLYLMAHAGYPGSHHANVVEREVVVKSEEERKRIQEPTVGTIVKEAFRGFG